MKHIKEYHEFLNEGAYRELAQLHYTEDQKEFDKLYKEIMKDAGWSKSDMSYSLNKFRKDIGYKGDKVDISFVSGGSTNDTDMYTFDNTMKLLKDTKKKVK